MANSSYIALIKCAHCGNESATVHQQQTGTKKGRLYYRCYSEINGSVMLCGTIQCIGQTGQKYINDNMRPIGQHSSELPTLRPIGQSTPLGTPPAPQNEPIGQSGAVEPEVAPIAETIEQENEPAPAPRRSVLDYLVNG